EIDVDWDDNGEGDFDHYRLERADNASFTGASSFTTTSSDYADSGLTPGEEYHYRVFAVDAGGNESSASGSDSAVATDLPPAAPTGLGATPGAGEGEIDVDWDDNTEPDFDHYRLERADNASFTGASSFTTTSSDYADSGLTPGQTYHYRAFAVDAGGNESTASGSDSAVATDLPPAAPTGLTLVPGPGEGEIEVSWDANSEADIDRYRLERDTDGGFGPGSDPFEQPATHFADSGLTPGEEYFYRVIAIDAGGNWSAPSTVESAIALDLAPAAPSGLTAVPGAGEGEIDVDWDDSTEGDFDHYRLERADNPSFTGASSFTTASSDYADSGLTPGEEYHYRVFAVDGGGNESGASDADSAIATDAAPAAPTGLMAEEGTGEGEILLTWNASMEFDLDRYVLERDTSDVFGAGTTSFETTDESYLDSGLDTGVAYYYRLFAVDVGGNQSAPSDTVDLTLEGTDVPEDLVAAVSFIRPNPFADRASIAYSVPAGGAHVTLRIYDIRGRLVRTLVDDQSTGGVYEAVWHGRDSGGREVASGIYFCRAEVGEVSEIRKLVLIR
ncbi:MAG: hypothetical protein GF400_08205, partial [Candidatus Eisenbacteria bacterium]|nr:hypothetical protein [Candidatus Eisenbacteria bacterium]